MKDILYQKNLGLIFIIIILFRLFSLSLDKRILKNTAFEIFQITEIPKKSNDLKETQSNNTIKSNSFNPVTNQTLLEARSKILKPIFSQRNTSTTSQYLRDMAKFANMAYCSPRNSVGLFVKKGIIVDLFLIKRDPILGYEGTENYSVIVYFRGRNLSLKEWKKRDSVLIKYKIPEILRQKFKSFFVDRVWYKHVKAMIEEGKLFEKIEKLVMIAREVVHKQLYAQAVKVTFTGHGIGGAYATLAGALYKLNELLFYKQGGHQGLAKPFGDLMAIYTYGQPRVGDERFASFLNENSFISRVTHTNDYVSQFPVMSKEKRKYLHANFEYWISKIPCDCYDQKLDGYQLIRCDVFKLPGENPYCNRGQRYTKGSLANQGPYFGVTMGKCDKGMEDIII